ncbi:Apolipoprotein N-acyltransferase / Copper homeostasis protein CutE [hydrothermal vent metagenome]|uniref:Apolipoprotein N-acyltransferase / Copper homeostasis protein CutE n=1 Tax=hydrothermal vent metagenome TaxID=652676 RepID=A0A3B1CSI9_9ZZZZ
MLTPNGRQPWILSTLTGTLLVLIFPRVDYGFLAWFALIPLFFLIHEQPLAKVTQFGFWTGVVFYFFGLLWVTNTIINYGNVPVVLSYLILALLAAYLGLYFALFCYLLKKFSRGNPLSFLWLAPVLWTALEYLRSTHATYGFSWLGLGYSQAGNLPVIQMAELTGIYGISTLIVFINASLFFMLHAWLMKGKNSPTEDFNCKPALRVLGFALVVLALWLGYGNNALEKWRESSKKTASFRVALAQGNIPQNLKWNPLFQDKVTNTYRELSLKAVPQKPDLIVWPEAAIPFYFTRDKINSLFVRNIARATKTPLLFGGPHLKIKNKARTSYNSAFVIDQDGQTLGRYDKIHLVPFGEFVPFQDILWFVNKMVEGIGNFGRGEKTGVFEVKDTRLGISICYEIIFPDLVRQSVQQGAQFLVNITNDAWFGKSAAAYQHMDMVALRAVENRVPIVRAANTGITGAIDPTGYIRQATELFTTELVITDIYPNQTGKTFYTQHGDVFSQICLLLTVLFALRFYLLKKQKT